MIDARHLSDERKNRAIRLVMHWAEGAAKTHVERNWFENIQWNQIESHEAGEGPHALANWNKLSEWNETTQSWVTISELPRLLGDLLEKLGVDTLWEDEWTECSDCSQLVRTYADWMGWRPRFLVGDGELVCSDCMNKNPEDFCRALEGVSDEGVPAGFDLEKAGYVLVSESAYGSKVEWITGTDHTYRRFFETMTAARVTRAILDDGRLWVHSTQVKRYRKRLGDYHASRVP